MATFDQARVMAQLALAEPKVREAFLRAVALILDENTLAQVTRLIEQGKAMDALRIAESAARLISSAANRSYVAGAERISQWIGDNTKTIVSYDRVNTRAVQQMQNNQLRIVREFTQEQRAATRNALTDGVRRGINPRAQAQAFRDSIGLTQAQEQIVRNYRRQLENADSGALGRRLRDRRSDRTVRSAILNDEPLAQGKVDQLVDRYRENWVGFRAETIARTEALRATHEGSREAFRQAIDQGELDPGELVRTWRTAHDGRVRDSHRSMDGQERDMGESFVSGAGNRLQFPGDPSAPADEIVQCRCVVVTRVKFGRRAA
jgi:hypothetical protein